MRGPVAATFSVGFAAASDGSMSSSRDIVETTPSISTSSRRRNPWSRDRYSSKRATGIGFCCSTFMAPSPRPIENDARPPETPCSVAIASAARSGWRSGTATAVPTFSVVVAAAASARTTYGSGSRPCASPTASPSQPLASNSRAKRPMSVDGTGVAPIRQNSARPRMSGDRDHAGVVDSALVELAQRNVGVEDGVGQTSRGGAVADGDERGNLAVELTQQRVVGTQPRPDHEQLGLDLRRLAR